MFQRSTIPQAVYNPVRWLALVNLMPAQGVPSSEKVTRARALLQKGIPRLSYFQDY